ncbi:MAG: hypothetical protein ACE5IL_00535 [Myxococcota bacterium]
MAPRMARLGSRALVLTLLVALLVALTPDRARAFGGQLCRAISTVALAPTDVILAPYIVYGDMRIGLTDYEDHWLALSAGFVPGIFFLHGMQVGGALFRLISGTFEVVPGLITFFRDEPPKPLFPTINDTWLEYSEDVGPCPIRIGAHWNSLNF